MAGTFVDKPVEEDWQNILQLYSSVLHEKAKKKTKSGAGKELIKLDAWYQYDLPRNIQGRAEKYLTQMELVDLVKWKLSRGKFRPRLVQFAESNQEEEVIQRSKSAFRRLVMGTSGGLGPAIQELCRLKGIGPATASAVLTAGRPDLAAFMADESVLGLLGARHLQYTLPEYLEYMEQVTTCMKALRKQNADFGWTPHQVELVVWTQQQMLQLGLTPGDLETSSQGDKRRATDSETSEEESLPKKSKKK